MGSPLVGVYGSTLVLTSVAVVFHLLVKLHPALVDLHVPQQGARLLNYLQMGQVCPFKNDMPDAYVEWVEAENVLTVSQWPYLKDIKRFE